MRVYVTKHGRVTSDLHFANALPADAQQLAARWRARCGVPDDPAAAAQSTGAPRVIDGVALVRNAGRLLRDSPRGAVLHADAAARVLQCGDLLPGLDQRPTSGVVVVGGSGRGGDADVAQPARVHHALRRAD